MRRYLWVLLLLLGVARLLPAQTGEMYSRRNTFTVFGEYSNDSSHIILGVTPNRKLGGAGAAYERRLLNRQGLTLAYTAEVRPVILNSDPYSTTMETFQTAGTPAVTETFSSVVFKCVSGKGSGVLTSPSGGPTTSYSYTTTCGRQSTFAQGVAPVGLRFHLRPHRPLQLTLSADGGYLFSTKPIPLPGAGSFNFTFNFGAGLEYFYAPHRSARLEYLVQHYSNHDTAGENPGVDSGYVRLSFTFGR